MSNLRVIEPENAGNDVIDTIERVLAMAEEGKLSSVAIAYVERSGCTGADTSEMPHQGAQIGAVAILLAHLTNNAICVE